MTYSALREHLARDIRAGAVKLDLDALARHLASKDTAGLTATEAKDVAGRFMHDLRAARKAGGTR